MVSTIAEVAEAFSRHDFVSTYPHLAPDVRWNMVGGAQIVGKEAVVGACDESSAYLSTATTTFTEFRLLTGDGFAVTDSTASYVDADGDSSVVSSCDIYRFAGDQLVEITSYTVEIPDDTED